MTGVSAFASPDFDVHRGRLPRTPEEGAGSRKRHSVHSKVAPPEGHSRAKGQAAGTRLWAGSAGCHSRTGRSLPGRLAPEAAIAFRVRPSSEGEEAGPVATLTQSYQVSATHCFEVRREARN